MCHLQAWRDPSQLWPHFPTGGDRLSTDTKTKWHIRQALTEIKNQIHKQLWLYLINRV